MMNIDIKTLAYMYGGWYVPAHSENVPRLSAC